MVYTLDGTVPTSRSTVYSSAIALPRGGGVYAARRVRDGRLVLVTSENLAGSARIGWKDVSLDGEELRCRIQWD